MKNHIESVLEMFNNDSQYNKINNVGIAIFDLENELTRAGTFCVVNDDFLDLSLNSSTEKFIKFKIKKTRFMTTEVITHLAETLAECAEVAQKRSACVVQRSISDISQLKDAVRIMSFALFEMYTTLD